MATRVAGIRRRNINSANLRGLKTIVRSLLTETRGSHRVQIDPEKGVDFYEKVAHYERELIRSALELTGGRQNRAAKLLNLRNSTLSAKMKQLGIERQI
jgi:DNA-binding NtrC family response regulator